MKDAVYASEKRNLKIWLAKILYNFVQNAMRSMKNPHTIKE